MEILAVTNGVVQIGVIVATARLVRAQRTRLALYWVSGAALVCSVAGLLAGVAPSAGSGAEGLISGAALWLLYIAIGVAVVAGAASALRQPGVMRFAWRQGKYQRYRTYRRI